MACRYAGIDGAADKHDVLVAEETGTELLAAAGRSEISGSVLLRR